GMDGMLRRAIYVNGEYNTYMILAGICGAMLLVAFALFLYNIVMSIGIKGLINIYKPATIQTNEVLLEKEK
ncbi:MAG: cbb3-type cytochrome c oxidase subunit I, partial [Epsilonproteobacteria bacterium]|nr:cbb3-type cytochrome c oxidase subunit I [Campylobacterota bacterium]